MRKLSLLSLPVALLATGCAHEPRAAGPAPASTVVVIPEVASAAPVPPASGDVPLGATKGSAVEPADDGRPDTGDRGHAPSGCGAPPPAERRGGDLIVTSPATPRAQPTYLRLRTQVAGALSSGSKRRWEGGEVPSFVPLVMAPPGPGGRATAELTILDTTKDGGFLAFYRDPYGAGTSCTLGGKENCAFLAAHYACDGSQSWQVSLNTVLSRKDHLEIQDVRYEDGVLYFNEGCQTYAKEAGGKCSSLVALDPKSARVLWRTPPLTSNNQFTVLPDVIVAGYGFTAEPDFVRLVRRKDGAILDTKRLPSAPSFFVVDGDEVTAHVYLDKTVRFHLRGADGASPKLVPER